MSKNISTRITSETTFHFSQLRDVPTTIYIVIPPEAINQIFCTTCFASQDELVEHGLLNRNKPSEKGNS